MKKILILFLLFVVFACKPEAKPENVKFLTSLHCEGCKTTITNKLDKLDGVLNFDIEVDTKIVSIKYDQNETDSLKLKTVLIDLGYTAKRID